MQSFNCSTLDTEQKYMARTPRRQKKHPIPNAEKLGRVFITPGTNRDSGTKLIADVLTVRSVCHLGFTNSVFPRNRNVKSLVLYFSITASDYLSNQLNNTACLDNLALSLSAHVPRTNDDGDLGETA